MQVAWVSKFAEVASAARRSSRRRRLSAVVAMHSFYLAWAMAQTTCSEILLEQVLESVKMSLDLAGARPRGLFMRLSKLSHSI